MTQHLLEQDNIADTQAMRQLFSVIGGFAVATAIMALAIGVLMG